MCNISQEARKPLAANCIWISTKCQNKQTTALFSICNKPSNRQVTASCLAHREWNRLYTWGNTAYRVAFFKWDPGAGRRNGRQGSTTSCSWDWIRPEDRWGRCTAQGRSEERLVREVERERGEKSSVLQPVRRENKVHLFIPSSFVSCHCLKTLHSYFCLLPLFFTLASSNELKCISQLMYPCVTPKNVRKHFLYYSLWHKAVPFYNRSGL